LITFMQPNMDNRGAKSLRTYDSFTTKTLSGYNF